MPVSADLPELPGVPATISPIRCPACDQPAAEVRHSPAAEPGAYTVTLICGACGAIFDLETTAYAAGLAAGVLAERARQAGPYSSPESLVCPECGSTDFELFLGGRHSGEVSCRGCGLMFAPPEPEGASK